MTPAAKEMCILGASFLIAATVWYAVYVGPNDERLSKISACMGDDLSVESYERCVQLVRD